MSSEEFSIEELSAEFFPSTNAPLSEQRLRSSFKRDEKVENSLRSLTNVSERLNPSVDTRMSELGMTINQLRFSSDLLYGRDKEVALLEQALERTLQEEETPSQLVMIGGYSGVGKSALALHLEKPVQQHKGFFCSGKHDLQDRNLPYAAISTALTLLVDEIRDRQDSERFLKLQSKVVSAVGKKGYQELETLVPNVQLLFGDDSTPARRMSKERAFAARPVGSMQSKAKLMFLARQLIRVICEIYSPVVILLDDLQWVDTASLELLHALVTDRDIRGLLILGCYRDNEVGNDHKLTAFLKDLQGVQVTSITVENLDENTINSMLVDVLQSTDSPKTQALAHILHERTFGNIFFVIQFLKALREMKLLNYNIGKFEWQWDNKEIESRMNVTDNVAELMRLEMESQLSEDARIALQLAACLGNEFEEATIVLVMTKLSEKGLEDGSIWGAPTRTADNKQVLQCLEQCVDNGFLYRRVTQATTYRFVHDMIQGAALSLVEDDKLEPLQFTMGKILVENLPTDQAERNLFLTVDFLNSGATLKTLEHNRSLLVDLNLQAGKKALRSSAFEAAAKYLSLSAGLLGHDCWQGKNYPTTLEVFSTAAQAEYCNGNLDQCQTYIDGVLAQTDRPVQDKIPSYLTLIELYNIREQHAMALSTSLSALRMLGAKFPKRLLTPATIPSLIKTQILLRNMDETKLLSLPVMTDKTKLMAMKLMDIALNASYMLNSPYLALIEFKMIRWTLRYGVCPQSAVAFAVFGLILVGSMGDLKRARVMGNVADELSKRPGFHDTRSRILMQTTYYIFHWTSPIQSCLKPLLLGYEVGMKIGDLENAFYNAYLYDKLALSAGRALNLVEADLVEFTTQMKIYSQETIYKMCLPHWQFVHNMTARSAPDPPILSGDIMEYHKMMEHLIETNHVYLQDVTRMNQLQLAFYFGDYQLAWKMVEESKNFDKTNLAHVTVWRRVFFMGMTAFCLAQSTNRVGFWRKKGSQAIDRLKKWVVSGNVNCIHLVRLLEAEEQALENASEISKVLRLFEKAISTASRAGYIHDRALALERAAEYLSSQGREGDSDRVRDHLELAISVYTDWGASAKVDHLKHKWATLLIREEEQSTS